MECRSTRQEEIWEKRFHFSDDNGDVDVTMMVVVAANTYQMLAQGPTLAAVHGISPPYNSARRFCLLSSLLHRWIGWSSERLNALLKVTQLVRIRGEVWRLRITAHDHYTVALIRGSQTCLLLVEERTHYLSAQTPYALPLPTLYLWKYVSLTWTAGDTPYIPNRIT